MIMEKMYVWNMLNLRLVCKSLWDRIPKEIAKRVYNSKRTKLEEALVRNRRDLLKINMQFNKIVQGPSEQRDQFIRLMLDNDDIVQDLRLMKNASYDDSKLEQFPEFVQYRLSPMKKIKGLNFWTIDVIDRKVGILLIPRQVIHYCYCQVHQMRHSILLLEAILHPWGFGIQAMLEDCEDEPFRKTRYLPVCDSRERIEEKLHAMNLMEESYMQGWVLEGSLKWKYAFEDMRHPRTPCMEYLRWPAAPSFGGGL